MNDDFIGDSHVHWVDLDELNANREVVYMGVYWFIHFYENI